MPPSDSPDIEKPTPTTRRRSVLALAVMLIVVALVPMSLGRTRIPLQFDQTLVNSFEASDAEIVFLGNSLLDTRIDPEYFGELTESSTVSMAIDGTAPGIWMLQLENIIGAVDDPPKELFIFFHDDLITRQIYFTGVKDLRLKESLTHSSTSSYAVAQEPNLNLGDRVKSIFTSLYPIAESGSRRDTHPVSSIGARIVGMSSGEMNESADTAFGFPSKRDRATVIQQPKYHGSFDSNIADSFLPSLIESASAIEADIAFVRTAARPNNDGSPNEPPQLAKYSADLEAYLEVNNIQYIDMTAHIDEGAIDAAMYYDGYHLKHRFRTYYTEFFAEWWLANRSASGESGGTP